MWAMWRDVQYGLRQWRRNKLFSVTIVLLLSIGLGANTLIFTFVNELLLKKLPVRNPENLFLLEKTRVRQVRPDPAFFYRQFEELRRDGKFISAAVAEQEWSDLSFQRFSSAEYTRLITTQIVSPNYFSELDIHAIAGRVLTERDAAGGQANIPVVLSYQFWKSEFHGKPEVIGHVVRVKSLPFVIVGVLPEAFHSVDVERAPDIRFPLSAAPLLTGSTVEDPRGEEPIAFKILVRLAPGVSAGEARSAGLRGLQSMEADLWRNWWKGSSPAPWPQQELEERIQYEKEYRLEFEPAGRGLSRLREQFSKAALLLMGAVAILMLGVCANVAALLLAKSQSRKQELALRAAMGAGRLQLSRMLFGEHLLLGLPSAVLGAAFAYMTGPWLIRLLPGPRGYVGYAANPQILTMEPDVHVLAFAITLAVFCIFVFGLGPGWRSTQVDLAEGLRSEGRHTTTRDSGLWLNAVGAALAIILLTGAVAMSRTFWNLEHVNPGFDPSRVVEFTISPEMNGYSLKQAASFRRELRGKVSELPGVESVSYASMGLMRGIGTKTTVAPRGTVLPARTFLNTSTVAVTPEYFRTLGIPFLGGRNLDPQDVGKKPANIVVNRAFANSFFGGEQNITGREVVEGVDGTKSPTAVIVGVIGTAKYRSLREVDPPIYYSVSNDSTAGMFLYARTNRNPAMLVRAVRQIIRGLDPSMPIIEASTLEQEVQNTLWQERLITVLAGFFGVVALLLSGIGMYGTLAYSVARRSKELGIRIAIGAQRWDVVRAICSRLIWGIAAGMLAGLLGSMATLRVAKGLWFGLRSIDPFSMMGAIGLLVLFSAGSMVWPVVRAAQTDPVIALRER